VLLINSKTGPCGSLGLRKRNFEGPAADYNVPLDKRSPAIVVRFTVVSAAVIHEKNSIGLLASRVIIFRSKEFPSLAAITIERTRRARAHRIWFIQFGRYGLEKFIRHSDADLRCAVRHSPPEDE